MCPSYRLFPLQTVGISSSLVTSRQQEDEVKGIKHDVTETEIEIVDSGTSYQQLLTYKKLLLIKKDTES